MPEMEDNGMRTSRQLNRRQVLGWGAAATSVLALDACGASVPTSSSSREKVTVVVAQSGTEVPPADVHRWNAAHPRIQIQMTDLEANSSKLAAELASGTAPDIIRLYGAGELAPYIVRGVAMDITSRLEANNSQYPASDFEPVDSVFRFNGTVQGKGSWYGMPKDWSPDFTLWYNKDIFAKAGIPEPSSETPVSWPDLFSLAKELTGSGRFGLGYGGGNTQLDASLLLWIMSQRRLNAWSADHKKAKFNQSGVGEIVNEWANQVVKPNLGPNSVNGSTIGINPYFPKGQIAMALVGYWFSGAIRGGAYASQKDSFATAPAPITSGGRRISPTESATGAIINAHTKHPDQAWQVFSYIYGKDRPQLERAQTGWGLPTFKSRWSQLPHDTTWDRALLAVAQRELKYFGVIDYNPYVGVDAMNTAIASYINPVYSGQSSVSSALQQLEDSINHTITATRRSLGHD